MHNSNKGGKSNLLHLPWLSLAIPMGGQGIYVIKETNTVISLMESKSLTRCVVTQEHFTFSLCSMGQVFLVVVFSHLPAFGFLKCGGWQVVEHRVQDGLSIHQ